MAIGGIDRTTGLPLVGMFKSFATGFGTAVPLTLSSLSSVYTYLVSSLGGRDAATNTLARALGVTRVPGLDFATFDPFSAALAGTAEGSNVYAGSIQFFSLATGLSDFLGATQPGLSAATLTAKVYGRWRRKFWR